MKRLKHFILQRYESSDFVLRKKAHFLYQVSVSAMILLTFPIVINASMSFHQALVINIINVIMITTHGISLVLLKKGKYRSASNVVIVLYMIIWHAGIIFKYSGFIDTGINTFFFLMFVILGIAVMFGTPFVFKVCFSLFLITCITKIILGNVFATPEVATFITRNAINMLLSLVGLFIIMKRDVTILNEALFRTQYELDKNIELNKTLEAKVLSRTEALQIANTELSTMNEALVETRDALWGEMQIAKKIQTVLLPHEPKVPGYEITAYMKPADDVGGDYYDVINVEGYNWLVIGDVSGHGIPAGLVMFMVQTAIHNTLEQNPGISPGKLISVINRTIYNNLKRLDENKYMTITVFLVNEDGSLVYSGLHQNILIYRSEMDSLESIETNGAWVGLMEDVECYVQNNTLTMGENDVMFLYTDGITEAWEKGSTKHHRDRWKMFSETRLKNIILEHGKKDIGKIRDIVLESLQNYVCSDDITMMLVKKCSV